VRKKERTPGGSKIRLYTFYTITYNCIYENHMIRNISFLGYCARPCWLAGAAVLDGGYQRSVASSSTRAYVGFFTIINPHRYSLDEFDMRSKME